MKDLKLLLLVLAVVAGGMYTLPASSQQQAVKRPNIIFILSDDHGLQATGAYGNKLVRTPNIDRIAREGALFKNALVTNSICGPSRATFITGKYSHKNGYKMNEGKFNTDQLLFPALLQQNGYQTAWIGKWHLGSLPKGFDYYDVLPGQGNYYNPDFIKSGNDTVRHHGYVSNIITELTKNWLDGRDKEKPFFLVVGEKAAHRSWEPDIQDLGAFDNVTFPIPATFYDTYENRKAAADQDMSIEKTLDLRNDLKVHALKPNPSSWGLYGRLDSVQKHAIADYYEGKVSKEFDDKKLSGKALTEWKYQRLMRDYFSVVNSLDRNIGEILDYVEKNGLKDNTVIVYASDNGFYLGEHGWFDKRFIYEESLKIPLLIRYPGVVKPSSTITPIVLNNDWGATMLDIAGVKVPEEIQGASFLPLLKATAGKGKQPEWRKDAYYHYYEFPQPHHVHPHFGLRSTQYTLVRFYGAINSWELYDLNKDPNQLNNLYGGKGYEAITADLKNRLKKLIIKYDDQEALEIFNKN